MRAALSTLLLAGTTVAQSFVVSPIPHTDLEGPSNNTYPWNSSFRYQQVHTDLVGTPRVITGIGWRRNQDQFSPSSSGPRVLDMELMMCDSSASAWSSTFASNYIGTPVTVLLRKQVNAPDWRPAVAQRPTPFDFTVPFDTPFVYLAQNDLLYEVVVHSTSATSTYMSDAVEHVANVAETWGSYTSVGSGCTTSTGAFLLRSQIQHVLASSSVSFAWDMLGAPAAASGVLLLGLLPLDVPLPGLCTNLYTEGSLVLPFMAANDGTAGVKGGLVPFDPSWLSIVLSGQAAAVDATQPGLGLAASQGVRCSIPPPMLPTVRGARAWALGNPTALSGSSASTSWLVTQFRF